jgi:hypothetical protein
MNWRAVAFRWFVQYNPLYFASALCVLAGVFLVAHGLHEDDFASKLGIAASTEVYQLLLIAGAWLLLRSGQRRAATLLGLAALVFLMDVSLDGERIFSHARTMDFGPGMRARRALPASLLLALLGPLKLWVLSRVFRLRRARGIAIPAGLVVALLPLLPYLVEGGGLGIGRRAAHLSVFWLGAPLFGWGFSKAARGWTSRWAPDSVRAGRIAQGAPFIVTALFILHGAAWSTFPGLFLSAAHFAPYALAGMCVASAHLAVRRSRAAEPVAWAGAAVALAAAVLSSPANGRWPVGAVALMTGASLLALSQGIGLRVLLPAAVCGFAGAYTLATGSQVPWPAPGPEWPAMLSLVLLASAAWHREFRCLFASAVAAGAMVVAVHHSAGVPFGVLLMGTWLACWSWLIFPELRSWVPFASSAGVLALGAVLLWHDPSSLALWYGASGGATLGVGLAVRKREFLGEGAGALGWLAIAMRGGWMPRTSGSWGIALLVAGFVLLSGGVALNLVVASRRSAVSPESVSE